MPSPDPWTAFLGWLQTIVVPNWGELISMLPFFIVVGVVGPLLTLIMLMWVWHLLHRRQGHVKVAEPEAVPAQLDANGVAIFPPNMPFCETHKLIHPPNAKTCVVDELELSVICPVDKTVRVATEQTCRVCGTRYVLGASGTAFEVVRGRRPPEGGAAVA